MKHFTVPRALRSTVFATATPNPEALLTELADNVRAFRQEYNDRLNNLQSAMSVVADRGSLNAPVIGGGAIDQEYSTAFASYTRRGDSEDMLRTANATGERAAIRNAMSVGSNTDGGYVAPVEWDRQLYQRQRANSPMRRLATVQVTSVGAFTSLWSDDSFGSGWVGETAARPATTSPQLSPISFAAGEIYANLAASQRLLDDAAINIETWLTDGLEREFTRQESIAFISGDGVNKPAGLLTFAPGQVNEASHPGGSLTEVAGAVSYDGLIDFSYGLGAPYRQNASWLMSSLTAAVIAKLKDANGQPIWREGLVVGQPATLLGRPVEIDEGMPAPDAGNDAIAFGDFKAGYLINDRFGTRILRDPYTNKPFVMFYATKRVGAGVLDPNAIRLLKVA
jgi:HK97 family phage major capsid protein